MWDADGNWHVGAMATLIDDVGGAATYSVADHVKATLDLNISFYSTARIQVSFSFTMNLKLYSVFMGFWIENRLSSNGRKKWR